jgi:hypothetical protein
MQEPERAGMSWTALLEALKRREVCIAYVRANFCRRIPDSNDFHVSRYECFALALLPVKHQPGVHVARDEIRQCPERSYYLNVLIELVVAIDLERPVRRPYH